MIRTKKDEQILFFRCLHLFDHSPNSVFQGEIEMIMHIVPRTLEHKRCVSLCLNLQ
jgi:hypothetical protein